MQEKSGRGRVQRPLAGMWTVLYRDTSVNLERDVIWARCPARLSWNKESWNAPVEIHRWHRTCQPSSNSMSVPVPTGGGASAVSELERKSCARSVGLGFIRSGQSQTRGSALRASLEFQRGHHNMRNAQTSGKIESHRAPSHQFISSRGCDEQRAG